MPRGSKETVRSGSVYETGSSGSLESVQRTILTLSSSSSYVSNSPESQVSKGRLLSETISYWGRQNIKYDRIMFSLLQGLIIRGPLIDLNWSNVKKAGVKVADTESVAVPARLIAPLSSPLRRRWSPGCGSGGTQGRDSDQLDTLDTRRGSGTLVKHL